MILASEARGRVRFLRLPCNRSVLGKRGPFIRYPVGWRIKVPKLAADVVFRPFVAHQEIPVSKFISGPRRKKRAKSGMKISGNSPGKDRTYPVRIDRAFSTPSSRNSPAVACKFPF